MIATAIVVKDDEVVNRIKVDTDALPDIPGHEVIVRDDVPRCWIRQPDDTFAAPTQEGLE